MLSKLQKLIEYCDSLDLSEMDIEEFQKKYYKFERQFLFFKEGILKIISFLI